MLPSSSSQIARYGHINHYKKFWLLQTQLEKQEQGSSACSATFSLQGNSSSIGAGHTACMRESSSSSKPSSLLTHHGSGDYHSLIAPQMGICRMESSSTAGSNGASCSSSRVMGAVHTSMTFEVPYLSAHSYVNLRAPDTNSMRDVTDRPRLSLAVHCENSADAVKTLSGPSTALSSQTCCDGAVNTDSFRKKDKQAVRCGVGTQAQYTSSGCNAPSDELRLSASFCNRPESHPASSKSSPSATVVNPRTCTLCGTSRTPLWRSGPNGPKSLCNACGIRVKKTKRLEAALHVSRASSSPPPSIIAQSKGPVKTKHSSELLKEAAAFRKKKKLLIEKQKKSWLQGKMIGKYWPSDTAKLALLHGERGKICANALAEDVEQAAVLLMALSCGLVLS